MPKPKRGEVWLVRFPFTDLTSTKLRPALVWAGHGEDGIVEVLLVDEVLAVGDTAFQKRCLGKMGEVAKEGRTAQVRAG